MSEEVPTAPRRLRVVVADDTPGVRLLMRHILEGSGAFEVVAEAGDGRRAVEFVSALQPDLVLLDIMMPELDGLEAIPRIRSASPRSRILMLSAFAPQGVAVRHPSLGGPDGYLEKRQRPDEILRIALQVCAPADPADTPEGLGDQAAPSESTITSAPTAETRPASATEPVHRGLAGASTASAGARASGADLLDALQRAHADLAQIGAAASHDLKSPLQAVMGFAHLLDQLYGVQLDERARMFVRTIIEATERMAALIDGLGVYCQAASSRPQPRSAALGEVVDSALAPLQRQIADQGAGVAWEALPQVEGDPALIALVVHNLVANALQWGQPSDGGPAQVSISAEGTPWGWTISVQDSGPGIAVDQRARVFGLFARPAAGPARPGSSGAGLAACKRVVEGWGGRIWIEEPLGGGCRLCFTLPASAEARSAQPSEPTTAAAMAGQPARPAPESGRSLEEPPARDEPGPSDSAKDDTPHILLIEDSEPHARLVAATLQEAPGRRHRLQHVADLRQARAILGDQDVDCVLLDLSLPDGEGLDSLAQVQAMKPSIPVVVLTSRADESLAVAAVQQGAQDYLVKGAIDPAMLGRAIRYAIERKALEAQLAQQALHDPLTGLPNRTLLLDRLTPALVRSGRNEEKLALLYLDLDGFKPINDEMGHEAGDGILVAVARRLTSMVRPHDTVARIGGDEFAVLCEGFHAESEIQALARRMAEKIAEPVAMGGQRARVAASIGIAFASGPGGSVEELMRQADQAMYANKRRRRTMEIA